MNGIDISAWQGDAGIDLAKVPYDFASLRRQREQTTRTDTLQRIAIKF